MIELRCFMQVAVVCMMATGLVAPRVCTQAHASPPPDSAVSLVRKKPSIFFYHDGRHPLIYMYEPPIHKEQFEAAIDELAGTPVEALMFCLGDGRTVLHDTKIGELWGNHIERWPHLIFRRAHQNARKLIAEGNDPLRIICERAHKKGMLIYPSLIVNQPTGERGTDVRTSLFRLNNPQLEIGAGGGVSPKFRGFRNLDFKYREVRDERMALIKETLSRYQVDGFELQLDLWPYYFRPDEVDTGRGILTAWIEDVHRAVNESGPNRELVVRVPANLEACEAVGLDVREWIRRGMVDVVIGMNYVIPGIMDQTLDLRPLVAEAKGSKTRVLADFDTEVDSDRMADSTTEMVRAAACNYWAQEVDGFLLDGWFHYWPYDASFYEKLRELPHPDVLASKDKSYFVPTAVRRKRSKQIDVGPNLQLPRDLTAKQPVTIQWTVSDDLMRWQKVGRVHKVLLRVRLTNAVETDRVQFKLNGKQLPESSLRKINNVYKMRAPRYRVFGYWYVFTLDEEHWPVQGTNSLEMALKHRDADIVPHLAVRDVELNIKYLMGKNFHRTDDVELGPSESRSY